MHTLTARGFVELSETEMKDVDGGIIAIIIIAAAIWLLTAEPAY